MSATRTPVPPANHRCRVGDFVEVRGLPGCPTRRGQVVRLLGSGGHERYLIKWDEKHESIYFPADGSLHVLRHGKVNGAR